MLLPKTNKLSKMTIDRETGGASPSPTAGCLFRQTNDVKMRVFVSKGASVQPYGAGKIKVISLLDSMKILRRGDSRIARFIG